MRSLCRHLQMAALVALAAVLASAAQAQTEETLVSNFASSSSVTTSLIGQPFTTGANSGNYTLTAVDLSLRTNTGGVSSTTDILVRIVPNADDGTPDTSDSSKFITLTTSPTAQENSVNTYTAPAGATLSANTTYHVYATNAAGTGVLGTGALLGADWTREPGSGSGAGGWTMGLMLSHARGEGSYREAEDGGAVSSTVTGLYPYGRYAPSDRVTVWGTAGYGAGTLTLTPEPAPDADAGDRAPLETDLDLTMAAAGLRGVAVEAPPEGGPELAVKSDAMAVRTSSEAVADGAGGNLAASAGGVTRLRLGLEGTWPGLEIGTGTLEPRLEVGVRHDGGDAETGFGLYLGGGLAWSDPATGLRAEVRGRGLLSHESAGFRERGFSGSFGWDPAPGSERGPSLTLTQTLGGASSGGAEALLSRTALEGLAANDDGNDLRTRRLELKLGYGLAAFGDRFTLTPEAGVGLSDTGRDYSLVWRLKRDLRGDTGALELSLEATRRESANDDTRPEHEVGLRLTARF